MSWARAYALITAREVRKNERMDEGASEEKAKRWLQDQRYGKTATAMLFLELRQRLASTGRLHLSPALLPPSGLDSLSWQFKCGGTSLNHGLGKPPRLRVSAIGSMRRAASWSRASSEGPFSPPPRQGSWRGGGRVTRLRLAGPRGRHQISSVPVWPRVGR